MAHQSINQPVLFDLVWSDLIYVHISILMYSSPQIDRILGLTWKISSEHIIELPRWKHFSASFYVYVFNLFIYIWSPPHDPPTCCLYCDLQYNMLIFYVHILRLFVHIHMYIFIQTKTQQYSDTLWGGSLAENKKKHWTNKRIFGDSLGRAPWRKPKQKQKKPKNQKNKQQKTKKQKKTKPKKSKKPDPLEILQSPWFCFFFGVFFFSFLFWGGWAYIYIYNGWFEMPISFFWEWQAVGARCFTSFDHHTQKREGGVVSALDTKPCSFQNQTLLLL